MNYNFDENEMPYGILERFGLTQTMMVRKSRHEPDSAW